VLDRQSSEMGVRDQVAGRAERLQELAHKREVAVTRGDDGRARLGEPPLDDIERRGPGLILDQAERRGSQVLVWTE